MKAILLFQATTPPGTWSTPYSAVLGSCLGEAKMPMQYFRTVFIECRSLTRSQEDSGVIAAWCFLLMLAIGAISLILHYTGLLS